MSEQPLDLRRSMQIVRRHWIVVSAITILGLVAGGGYTVYKPPLFTSNALVELSTASRAPGMATQVVIAGSDDVLAGALGQSDSAASMLALRNRIKINSLTPSVLSITANGQTASAAEQAANAVAKSYVSYVTVHSLTLRTHAQLLQAASTGPGPSLPLHVLITGLLGAVVGLAVGAGGTLAFSRRDRRLRQRDEIADAIGVPVLASVPVSHPRTATDWARLLEDYQPSVAHAWRLRNAVHYLGLTEAARGEATSGGSSITILSLASDRRAVALGPQLAVFATSLGIPTLLVVGPQQNTGPAATLRAACSVEGAAAAARRSGRLRVAVSDRANLERPDVALTVVVAVVDGRAPQLTDAMRSTATVLGVSAGAATAEDLARVAAAAAADGRHIDGIFVADPDAADRTSGRIPQLVRPIRRAQPTRLTGLVTETRR